MARFKIVPKPPSENSHPGIKISLRKWLAGYFDRRSVLDVYGGHGWMYRAVWKDIASEYCAANGDALGFLSSCDVLDFDIFDVDPFASPFEALHLIGSRAKKERIGIVCTDGSLRRQGLMRGKLSPFLQESCGFPARDKKLLAAIYWQYPKFLRFILEKLMDHHRIANLAIKYGEGTWRQGTVYFAAVLDGS